VRTLTTSPEPTSGCPVCGSRELHDCLRIPRVPVYCNVLYDDRQAALHAATGEIDLVFCGACGHLFNAAFDPQRVEYSGDYENSLHYSTRFQDYATALAEQLVERHQLRGKTIIEIACGQGDFLKLLCSLGGNRGIGFDPGHVPGRSRLESGAELTFVPDYYSEAHAQEQADLICCRHALEHIPRPAEFVRMLRRSIGDRPTAIFFEVPNAHFTLSQLGIWDLIYEHCGYFCDASLREVFRRGGFQVDRIATEFGDQFLTLDGRPAGAGEPLAEPTTAPAELAEDVARFARAYAEKVERWRSLLHDLAGRRRRVVLWGAGSKGVSFVNTLQAGEAIDGLIDLNPHKHGRYIPGTGHQVHPPASLAANRPDVVIVMNPLYADEIGRDLHALGVDAEIIVDETG
jgi:hypothetical protein